MFSTRPSSLGMYQARQVTPEAVDAALAAIQAGSAATQDQMDVLRGMVTRLELAESRLDQAIDKLERVYANVEHGSELELGRALEILYLAKKSLRGNA